MYETVCDPLLPFNTCIVVFLPQGVSLEDIEKAEEVLRQGDSSKKPSSDGTTLSSRASIRDSQRDTTTTTTATTTTTTPSSPSISSTSSSLHNDRDRTSNLSSRDSLRDDTSYYRRRNLEDRLDVSVLVAGSACVMVYMGRSVGT